MYMFDPKEDFQEAMREWVSDFATGLARSALELAGKYITGGLDLGNVSYSYFALMSQMIAYGLLCIFFCKEILVMMKEDITQENEQPNWLALMGNMVVSASLITFTPYAIKDVLIPISNEFSTFVSKAPITWDLDIPKIESALAPSGWTGVAIHVIVMFAIWSVGGFAIVLARMITYAQLVIALIIGPIIATNYINRSAVLTTYWKEVIALAFTAPIQLTMYALCLDSAGKGTFEGLIWSTAFAIVGATGPTVLKSYLHRSGAGSAMVGGGKFVFYRVMMQGVKGVGKR